MVAGCCVPRDHGADGQAGHAQHIGLRRVAIAHGTHDGCCSTTLVLFVLAVLCGVPVLGCCTISPIRPVLPCGVLPCAYGNRPFSRDPHGGQRRLTSVCDAETGESLADVVALVVVLKYQIHGFDDATDFLIGQRILVAPFSEIHRVVVTERAYGLPWCSGYGERALLFLCRNGYSPIVVEYEEARDGMVIFYVYPASVRMKPDHDGSPARWLEELHVAVYSALDRLKISPDQADAVWGQIEERSREIVTVPCDHGAQ